jgi:hypothetical protein
LGLKAGLLLLPLLLLRRLGLLLRRLGLLLLVGLLLLINTDKQWLYWRYWITDGSSATLCCAALPLEWVGKCMAEFVLKIKPKTCNCNVILFI